MPKMDEFLIKENELIEKKRKILDAQIVSIWRISMDKLKQSGTTLEE